MKRIPNILLTVQDADVRKQLESYLVDSGYRVHLATGDPSEADMPCSDPIDVMVCDSDAAMHAERVCAGSPEGRNGTYVIGIQDGTPMAAAGSKVDVVLTWPVDVASFLSDIASGVRIAGLEQRVSSLASQARHTLSQTVAVLTRLMHMYGRGLAAHCQRVSALSQEIAQRHGDVPEKALKTLGIAGLLHDIGMVALPESILTKRRTERTGDEQQLYLSHPVLGESLLTQVESFVPVARIVRWHHEQFNGCGFPDGLQGTAIPLLARIVAAASVYDNVVHRGRTALDDVPTQLQQFSGYQLDPAVVDIVLDINRIRIHEEARRNFRMVYFEDLEVGMTLAQPVQMASGATAVPENTRLTPETIEKLKEFILSDNLSDTFFIFK